MDLPDLPEIVQKIKIKMLENDVRAIKVAEATGLHKAAVSKALSGKIKSYETLRAISLAVEEIIASSANGKTVSNMLARKKPVTAFEDDDIRSVKEKMRKNSFSQIPVVGVDGRIKGLVTDRSLLDFPGVYYAKDALSSDYAVVSPDKSIEDAREIIKHVQALLLQGKEMRLKGILTKADFI
ncbi:MAG: CBS domain-containing protein [Thaumarchaeota archaeon]|nr:CBS domain-containing protein [Nitrososphaerota archaeon]